MKNITNLDIKRQRVGLTKELSAFAVVGVYKKSPMKTKLEIIGLVEVLKHTEKNYREALDLIFKLEKVKDVSGIISKLSKQKLEAKVVSDVERLAMIPKPAPKPEKNLVIPNDQLSYFKKNKLLVIVLSSFASLFLIFLIFNGSSRTSQNEGIHTNKNYEKETFISLSPKFGHKYVHTTINGISTTFMLDTGASSSTVSQTYLNRHIRSGFVNRHTHFIRNGDYITANGDVVNAEVWQLPSVTMGPKTIYNVEIAVMPGIEETGFLLGMSTINKLGKPKIDLTNNKIIIN
ncbi:MAG: retropepsin-like aspartic protease [Flavobacteriaceae bacterium]|nr:retropepsin-like aspartic protease [Flavobacteriaceae bacterium]